MAHCNECNDTGIIETGNNDIPCHCAAGDAALFSCAGEGTISGAALKRLDRMRQMPTTPGDRTEYGHDFRWYERPGCWHTTAGKAVVVVPPTKPHESWLIIIPDDDTVEEFEGHEAEKRAFCLADGYRRQH